MDILSVCLYTISIGLAFGGFSLLVLRTFVDIGRYDSAVFTISVSLLFLAGICAVVFSILDLQPPFLVSSGK